MDKADKELFGSHKDWMTSSGGRPHYVLADLPDPSDPAKEEDLVFVFDQDVLMRDSAGLDQSQCIPSEGSAPCSLSSTRFKEMLRCDEF